MMEGGNLVLDGRWIGIFLIVGPLLFLFGAAMGQKFESGGKAAAVILAASFSLAVLRAMNVPMEDGTVF